MLKIILAPLKWIRALYDWVLIWGESKYGSTALFVLAVTEASFFPVPPDVLLVTLTMGAHKKWLKFALICSVGSVVGAVIGYIIGFYAFEFIGQSMLSLTALITGESAESLLKTAQYWFNEKEMFGQKVGPWAVGIAGFTPIPFKVFTISAGFFKMTFLPFVIASLLSRSIRFFAVAGLIGILYEKKGDKIKVFIDKYFNLLAFLLLLLFVLGFMSLKFVKG